VVHLILRTLPRLLVIYIVHLRFRHLSFLERFSNVLQSYNLSVPQILSSLVSLALASSIWTAFSDRTYLALALFCLIFSRPY